MGPRPARGHGRAVSKPLGNMGTGPGAAGCKALWKKAAQPVRRRFDVCAMPYAGADLFRRLDSMALYGVWWSSGAISR